MKKLFLSLATIILCLLMSCKDTSTTDTTKSQSEINKENTKTVFKGIETGDMSAMDSFVSKDIVDHANPMGDVKGLDNVKKMLGDMHNHISNLKIDMIANATDGDYEFTLERLTGTTKDATMGMPANTHIDQITVGVIKTTDGKSTEHWNFSDPKDIMKMMEMQKGMAPMDNKMKDTMMKK